MLEIFKALLDTVSKLLDPTALSNLVKEKRKEELGAKLFMLYVVIDEICIGGEGIIADLESYLATMSGYLANKRWALGGLKTIRGLHGHVLQQLRNLSQLENVLGDVSTELRIVDPLGYRKLKLLTRDYFCVKRSDADRFFNLSLPSSSESHLPLLGPTARDLLDAAEELAHGEQLGQRIDAGKYPRQQELEKPAIARIAHVQELYQRSAEISGLWDESVFAMVQEYLTSREPRKQLAELRAIADGLRSSLEQVFPLSDILWLVGSRKFRERYGRVVP